MTTEKPDNVKTDFSENSQVITNLANEHNNKTHDDNVTPLESILLKENDSTSKDTGKRVTICDKIEVIYRPYIYDENPDSDCDFIVYIGGDKRGYIKYSTPFEFADLDDSDLELIEPVSSSMNEKKIVENDMVDVENNQLCQESIQFEIENKTNDIIDPENNQLCSENKDLVEENEKVCDQNNKNEISNEQENKNLVVANVKIEPVDNFKSDMKDEETEKEKIKEIHEKKMKTEIVLDLKDINKDHIFNDEKCVINELDKQNKIYLDNFKGDLIEEAIHNNDFVNKKVQKNNSTEIYNKENNLIIKEKAFSDFDKNANSQYSSINVNSSTNILQEQIQIQNRDSNYLAKEKVNLLTEKQNKIKIPTKINLRIFDVNNSNHKDSNSRQIFNSNFQDYKKPISNSKKQINKKNDNTFNKFILKLENILTDLKKDSSYAIEKKIFNNEIKQALNNNKKLFQGKICKNCIDQNIIDESIVWHIKFNLWIFKEISKLYFDNNKNNPLISKTNIYTMNVKSESTSKNKIIKNYHENNTKLDTANIRQNNMIETKIKPDNNNIKNISNNTSISKTNLSETTESQNINTSTEITNISLIQQINTLQSSNSSDSDINENEITPHYKWSLKPKIVIANRTFNFKTSLNFFQNKILNQSN